MKIFITQTILLVSYIPRNCGYHCVRHKDWADPCEEEGREDGWMDGWMDQTNRCKSLHSEPLFWEPKEYLFLLNDCVEHVCPLWTCDSFSALILHGLVVVRTALGEQFLLTFCSTHSVVIALLKMGACNAAKPSSSLLRLFLLRQEKHCSCRLCHLIVYLPLSFSLSLSPGEKTCSSPLPFPFTNPLIAAFPFNICFTRCCLGAAFVHSANHCTFTFS